MVRRQATLCIVRQVYSTIGSAVIVNVAMSSRTYHLMAIVITATQINIIVSLFCSIRKSLTLLFCTHLHKFARTHTGKRTLATARNRYNREDRANLSGERKKFSMVSEHLVTATATANVRQMWTEMVSVASLRLTYSADAIVFSTGNFGRQNIPFSDGNSSSMSVTIHVTHRAPALIISVSFSGYLC